MTVNVQIIWNYNNDINYTTIFPKQSIIDDFYLF